MRIFWFALLAVAARGSIAAQTADDPHSSEIAVARMTAHAWLTLIEDGLYERGWDQASPAFQLAAPRADWEARMKGTREISGPVKSRQFKDALFKKTLPDGSGPCIAIEFDCNFNNDRSAIDLVTLTLDNAGVWQVASYSCAAEGQHEKEIAAARTAAEDWLPLVDKGNYGKSWEQAAQPVRKLVKQDAWEAGLKTARDIVGPLKSRQFKSAEFRTSLPGAADGQYVVLQYESSFESKKSATETITPMLEKDGVWRVSGYYLK